MLSLTKNTDLFFNADHLQGYNTMDQARVDVPKGRGAEAELPAKCMSSFGNLNNENLRQAWLEV
jgi:hypothetical protein